MIFKTPTLLPLMMLLNQKHQCSKVGTYSVSMVSHGEMQCVGNKLSSRTLINKYLVHLNPFSRTW